MLNAKPFPNQKGELGRIICSKTDTVDTGGSEFFPVKMLR